MAEDKAKPKPEAEAEPKTEIKAEPKPEAMGKTPSDLIPQIKERAYELYEKGGHEDGRSVQDWEKPRMRFGKTNLKRNLSPKPRLSLSLMPKMNLNLKPRPRRRPI